MYLSLAQYHYITHSLNCDRTEPAITSTILPVIGISQKSVLLFLSEKLKERRLRWYGHVQRRPEDHMVKLALNLPTTTRNRGRPPTTWLTTIQKDLKKLTLTNKTPGIVLSGELGQGRPTPNNWEKA
ncbi:hypothetical protein RR48_07242 [Papilio machaon]|uniref:Uncharacterized protein n=1 Tax=Papilio machaon TaxID=76193 RepID=A0A194RL05_PAPMA|nr:hypothetical protein RR48_07242 [Papilio machaon]